MRPRKVNGLTDDQRARRCDNKHRWADELAAIAGAIHAFEKYHNSKGESLWVYRCPLCKGWHLTKKPQRGQSPVVSAKATA